MDNSDSSSFCDAESFPDFRNCFSEICSFKLEFEKLKSAEFRSVSQPYATPMKEVWSSSSCWSEIFFTVHCTVSSFRKVQFKIARPSIKAKVSSSSLGGLEMAELSRAFTRTATPDGILMLW